MAYGGLLTPEPDSRFYFLGVHYRLARSRPAPETVAKMRESTTIPVCRAAHGHSRTPVKEVLQQSP